MIGSQHSQNLIFESHTVKALAIITGPATHLDHLGVLSTILNIPLIVTEETTYKLAKKFYPHIPVVLKDMGTLTLDFLNENADLIFQTGKFWAAELLPFFELLYGKKMRVVYCPHGNSDKGHSLSKHVAQDISLIYGNHMLDLLTKTKALSHTRSVITTGNYRLSFYLKHKKFYDNYVQKMISSYFNPNLEILFYAPTWSDKENMSSFFTHFEALVTSVKGRFNLLVKLHPFLEEDHPAETHCLLAKYENTANLFILKDFPPIYPLLEKASLYLGDFSSIGYDFLAFDKPLYFVNQKADDPSYLLRTGLSIPEGENIGEFIQKTWKENQRDFSEKRKEAYLYTFGEEKHPNCLRKEINESLIKPHLYDEV